MELHRLDSRVVVTGIGVITSLGNDIDTFFNHLLEGKSGIKPIERFDISEYASKIGGEITDFDAAAFMDPKEVKRSDRYTHYAVAASKQALTDASLDPSTLDSERFGVIVGSGIGGMETIQEQSWRLKERGPRKVSPFMIPSLIGNIASGVVAIEVGARGPNFSVVSACSTGTHALGEALHTIRRGEADIMIAGGSEAAITELGYGGFCAMRAMSTEFNDEPQRASRPFDAKRDGFVMGEGAGVMILESEAHAKARGAKIYAELLGYAASCDAYHITSPDVEGRGLALCLNNALKYSGLQPTDVDYINAHGTSTPYNDNFETKAVKKVFGEHAYKLAMSSTKSMTGHLLGAAGGIEAAAAVKAIETGWVPPTINYEHPDPECDLDYVPNTKRQLDVKIAMSNNLGFGGHNATVVFKRFG